ncbi:MAG TPA: ATP-dependent endonuclease [Planctomycetaceae bacterium]|nr:ATP-dependent endonuclease [Planctomycetaceae bacterium]
MKLIHAEIRHFRRLEDVSIDFEAAETVFVGPNNSGKTSATDVFRLFLKSEDFSIHDFSVSQVVALDKFGRGEVGEDDLPKIELDLWFSIDPDTEFGRAGLLLPDAEQDYDRVGIRLRFTVRDAEKLKESYLARLTPKAGNVPKKPLSYYLSLPGTINQHFYVMRYALDRSTQDVTERPLVPEEGKRLLESLVRVEFVDAQRKIDDHEHAGSTRLSTIFTRYYKRNLTQADIADDAHDLIDRHNEELTCHYAAVFADLLDVIKGLGVPSINDRALQVISSLVPEAVLQSNTTLAYVDTARGHELPEKYNGLGIKNLIFLAIQICEFHYNWMNTEENRPLTLVIFVEEPECHLHAQAQQTFIANAWRIISDTSTRCNEKDKVPQLVITTHSSHILHTVDFANVRYFRRCRCEGEDPIKKTALNATKVLNLRDFNPSQNVADTENAGYDKKTEPNGVENDGQESKETVPNTLDFLKRYLKLTHCDLFFADAAVLIEGTVEKLLIPKMIELEAPALRQRYLTVLEVGGAYAHCFADLLEFISIPYLVVTDIDSVDPTSHRAACRADTPGAVSSNAAIKYFLNRDSVAELASINEDAQHLKKRRCYIAYQKPSPVAGYTADQSMHGRTFEETFAYENIAMFRDGSLRLLKEWDVPQEHEAEHKYIYEAVSPRTFKKTDFALSVISSYAKWVTPKYIADGLMWLDVELRATDLIDEKEVAL